MSGRIKLLLIGCIAAILLSAPATAAALPAEHHESWTEIVRALFPIIASVGALIVTGIILGLATRFVTLTTFNGLKDKVERMESKVTSHDRRIQDTESHCKLSPSPQEIQEDISELGERMKGVEVGLGGVGQQLNTMNTYLHTLIDKDIRR